MKLLSKENKYSLALSLMLSLGIIHSSSALAEDELTDEEKAENVEKKALIKSIQKTKGVISSRYTTLESQRDRTGRLIGEMKNDTKIGCWQNVKIDSLELRIEGGHAAKKFFGKEKYVPPTTGKPSLIEVQLGDSLSFSWDENDQSVFQASPKGSIIRNDFENVQIKDIEFLRIRKGGVEYHDDQRCETKSKFFGFSKKTKCRFLISETARYQLNSVEILVNGELVYKAGGFSTVLEKHNGSNTVDGLVFERRDIKLDKNYQELMAREDCE